MLNTVDLVADEAEAVVIIKATAADEFAPQELASWLERNSRPLDPNQVKSIPRALQREVL